MISKIKRILRYFFGSKKKEKVQEEYYYEGCEVVLKKPEKLNLPMLVDLERFIAKHKKYQQKEFLPY